MKTTKTTLSCFMLLLFTSFTQGQTTVTFQPDGVVGKDATLNSAPSVENNNYGTSDHIEAAAWTYSGDPGVVRSLFEFTQLSTIPSNAIITSATLSLYAMDQAPWQHSTLSGSNEGWLERITSSWNESTVTWTNQPASTTLNSVSLAASISATQNYLNIDVTDLVQDMIDQPATSYGFILKLQTEDYYRRLGFGSSDHTNASLRPKLNITYTTTAGTNELEASEGISCYPNPSSDAVTIEVSELLVGSEFELVDQLGRKVKTGVLSAEKTTLSVDDLNDGYYMILVAGKKVTFVVE